MERRAERAWPRTSATRTLTIVGGTDKLALTPPLGWNSWNAWGTSVDAEKVKSAADWMVKTGLAAHGFQYINVDDGWEGQRDASGELPPNEKFPDMKALADYVHARGLKPGIYSSPGPTTCGGRAGSYQHEQQDANAWARWGIDLLKHDYCSYERLFPGFDVDVLQKPYVVMRQALDNVNRDILYSVGNYGYGEAWKWAGSIGDEFTIALLTNDEVLDVDQDPLSKAGGRIWKEEKLEVWARPLADGTTAVALFNRGLKPYDASVRWADIGVRGRQPVRDLWLRKDLGEFADSFKANVPRHGAVMIKVGRARM